MMNSKRPLSAATPHPSDGDDGSDSEIEGLTPWDLVREPRPVVTDDRTIRIDVRSLNTELACPVCLGILRNTVTVMECLHRFCDSCMQKCLRVGKKECPKCRIKVPSRRSLKRDAAFDQMIAQIYPDLEGYEQQQDKQIAMINKRMNFNNQFTRSSVQGAAQQDEVRRSQQTQKKPRTEPTPPAPAPAPAPSTAAAASSSAAAAPAPPSPRSKKQPSKPAAAPSTHEGAQDDVASFVLVRHPDESRLPALERAMLKTSSQFPVSRIKRFLSIKMSSVADLPQDSFKITIGSDPKDLTKTSNIVLKDDETLKAVIAAHWHFPDSVVLHYSHA